MPRHNDEIWKKYREITFPNGNIRGELTIFDRMHCNVLIVSLFITFTLFRCIVATGSPFRMTENKQFKALIQKLRPGTEVASRKYLSEKLLDEVYGEEKVGRLVKGQYVNTN